ncbi:hypothetical protein FHG87_010051 [Trinorchestia longiramus]|nr:hypothetical protein FHG87_010051 [Trinorchestia longiramus]
MSAAETFSPPMSPDPGCGGRNSLPEFHSSEECKTACLLTTNRRSFRKCGRSSDSTSSEHSPFGSAFSRSSLRGGSGTRGSPSPGRKLTTPQGPNLATASRGRQCKCSEMDHHGPHGHVTPVIPRVPLERERATRRSRGAVGGDDHSTTRRPARSADTTVRRSSREGRDASRDGRRSSREGRDSSRKRSNASHDGRDSSRKGSNASHDGRDSSRKGSNASHDGRDSSRKGSNASHDGRKSSLDVHNSLNDRKVSGNEGRVEGASSRAETPDEPVKRKGSVTTMVKWVPWLAEKRYSTTLTISPSPQPVLVTPTQQITEDGLHILLPQQPKVKMIHTSSTSTSTVQPSFLTSIGSPPSIIARLSMA